MVNIPPQMVNTVKYVAQFFQVRPEWLIFPNIVTIFIVPLIMNILAFYFIMNRLMRSFPTVVKIGIAGIVGFLLLPYNNILIFITPAVIGFFGPRSIWKKIIIVAILYAVNFLAIPFLFEEVTYIAELPPWMR